VGVVDEMWKTEKKSATKKSRRLQLHSRVRAARLEGVACLINRSAAPTFLYRRSPAAAAAEAAATGKEATDRPADSESESPGQKCEQSERATQITLRSRSYALATCCQRASNMLLRVRLLVRYNAQFCVFLAGVIED